MKVITFLANPAQLNLILLVSRLFVSEQQPALLIKYIFATKTTASSQVILLKSFF